MSRRVRFALVLGGLALVVPGRSAEAGHLFHRREGTPPPGQPRVFEHSPGRAGDPSCNSPHAIPTYTPDYAGYYVGGGGACGGCARRSEEGTWGRDYVGFHLPRRVGLSWTHGGREQGGTGSYTTDGPHIPDVIGLTASRLRNH